MQTYSDPSRADDPHALPDVEVFYITAQEANAVPTGWDNKPCGENEYSAGPGWYYWYCFPGCLPDSDPVGPFESAEDAERAAQEDATC